LLSLFDDGDDARAARSPRAARSSSVLGRRRCSEALLRDKKYRSTETTRLWVVGEAAAAGQALLLRLIGVINRRRLCCSALARLQQDYVAATN
jgi:hypothetical protein